jgi:hypothetical protein
MRFASGLTLARIHAASRRLGDRRVDAGFRAKGRGTREIRPWSIVV